MTRILVVDQECTMLDFVLRCVAWGAEVRWYRHSPRRVIRDGEGFKGFTVVDDWRPSMTWVGKDGLVITSGNFIFLQELDRYRDLGFKIFGPSVASARLEIQRSAGMEVMESIGVEIPPYQQFSSLEEADAFARKSDRAWVFKNLGSEDDKALTFVSSDQAELSGWIRQKIAKGMKLKGPCILQERIDMLCEFGVSGWMGADGFLPDKYQICFEHKKLFDGEIGCQTGEQGTVCQYVETDKIAEQMLLPLEPVLRSLGHRGDVAIGAMIDTKGKAQFLEFTMRAGWPAFYIQTASHKGSPFQWMLDAMNGKDSLKVSRAAAIGVVLSQPRYPFACSPPELVEGNPISGLEGVLDDIHMAAVMVGKGPVMEAGKVVDRPQYQTSGELVMVATGLGATIEAARKKVYGVVDQVKFPNKGYRTDIGSKVTKILPKLNSFGYAKGLE